MTYILTYHADAPSEGQEILDEELRRAEDYFDVLSRIRLKGRQEFRKARIAHSPKIARIEAQLEALENKEFALRKITREMRARDRKRTPVPPENKAQVQKIWAKQKQLREKLSPLLKQANAGLKPEDEAFKKLIDAEVARLGKKDPPTRGAVREELLPAALEQTASKFWRDVSVIKARENRAMRDARAVCGLCPGTYLLIEDQVDQSCKDSEPEPRHAPRDTLTQEQLDRRKIRKAEGRAGAQIHHLRYHDLWGKSHQLSLDPYVDDMSLSPRQRNRRRYTHVHLKLFGGKVTFRVLLHREIPQDVDVCRVWIRAIRQGTRRNYELQLVVKSQAKRRATGQAGTVAFDIGWRRLEDRTVRVATFIPEHGGPLCVKVPPVLENLLVLTPDGAEFRLPERYIADYSRVLRKAQDDVFNRMVAYVQKRRKAKTLPAWFQEDTTFITQWRNPSRLVHVTKKLLEEWAPEVNLLEVRDAWQKQCQAASRGGRKSVKRGTGKTSPRIPQNDLFPSPDTVDAWLRQQGYTKNQAFALTLYLWRRKNHHLYQWTCDQKSKDGRWLKDVFRVLARLLADNYNTLSLEKFDLRDVAKKSDDFDEDSTKKEANRQRHVANTHTMRECLVEAFGTRVDQRKGVSRQAAEYTTQDCHLCHGRCKWPQDKELTHTCEHCGETWDQDYNACWNLLRLHLAEAAQ